MFSGKGGVGKTTCAGAVALHYARTGFKTLVISTDPTPSLSDIFEVNNRHKPARVTDNLFLAELGTSEVREMWDKKFGLQVYEVFSTLVSIEYEEFVEFITSILPGLQEEFMVDYIKELAESGTYDKVVWDTAPLGQTMHLLNMPAMLREHLKPAPRIYSRLKVGNLSKRPVLKILEEWTELSAADVQFLREEVEFNLVIIPEALAIQQIDGVFAEFARHDFSFSQIIINNVIDAPDSDFLRTKREQQQQYISLVRQKYSGFKMTQVPLFPYEIKGAARLDEIAGALLG